MGTGLEQGQMLSLSMNIDERFGNLSEEREADATAVYPANIPPAHPHLTRQHGRISCGRAARSVVCLAEDSAGPGFRPGCCCVDATCGPGDEVCPSAAG